MESNPTNIHLLIVSMCKIIYAYVYVCVEKRWEREREKKKRKVKENCNNKVIEKQKLEVKNAALWWNGQCKVK